MRFRFLLRAQRHPSCDPLPVGTRLKVIGRNGLIEEIQTLALDHQMGAAIGAVVAERNQTLRRVYVDAILLVRKVRPAGASSWACDRTAGQAQALCLSPGSIGRGYPSRPQWTSAFRQSSTSVLSASGFQELRKSA